MSDLGREEQDALEEIGRTAAPAFRQQHVWIHRRVETLTYPAPTDLVSRRHVSIDFSVPDLTPIQLGKARLGLPPEDGARPRYYVPVSALTRWPPILRLDLRDAADRPIPLLTVQQNGIADYGLLLALAEEIAQCGRGDLPEDIAHALFDIATHSGQRPAETALGALLSPEREDRHLDSVRRSLRSDPPFVDVVGGLLDHAVLWLRAAGPPVSRDVAKVTYDVPFRRQRFSLRKSLAWRNVDVRLDTPHVGTAGSYHFGVRFPEPLIITDAELAIARRVPFPREHGPPEGDEGVLHEIVATCVEGEHKEIRDVPGAPAGAKLILDTYASGREAHTYLSGDRPPGLYGGLSLTVRSQKSGFIRGAALAAWGIAALIFVFWLRLDQVRSDPEAAVAVLLIVPVVLGYLLVRPGEHAFSLGFLKGLRNVLLLDGLLPLAGAVSLIATADGGVCAWLDPMWAVTAGFAVIMALMLTASAQLPRRPGAEADPPAPEA